MSEQMEVDPRVDRPPMAPPTQQRYIQGNVDETSPEPTNTEVLSRDDNDDQESEISDVDSDYLELNAETAKLDASIEAFRAEQRIGDDDGGGPAPAKSTKPSRGRGKRGPRKAAPPSPDILYRLSLATEAYHDRRYEEAHEMLAEIIRINAETFDAWTLLSTVFEEQGDRRGALMCLVAAAHLTPKVSRMWINAATYALDGVDGLEDDSDEKNGLLQTAMQCYSAAVRASPTDVAARTGKADVLMSLGLAGLAVTQYRRALKHRPLNIRTVRNLADAALDARDPRQGSAAAKEAYRHVIDHCQAKGTTELEEGDFEWSDLRIYLEFFAMLEQWDDAAKELAEVSRWLLGRRGEACWEEWLHDDREWDVNDDRRISVAGYEPGRFPLETYGLGLPVDLRARLCMYRLQLGQEHEAMLHLELLDLDDSQPHQIPALERFGDFPDCLKDVGVALLAKQRAESAVGCFELYRRIAAENEDVFVDSEMLADQGRCYLALGNPAAAEECLIAAIEENDENIDARFELARIYEGEQEKEGQEEAFLLVTEALNLEAQHVEGTGDAAPKRPARRLGPYMPGELRRRQMLLKPTNRRRTYRPRRLGDSEERRKYDQERTEVLSETFRMCQDLKGRVGEGDTEAIGSWMGGAKELIEDFRSSKDFYPWDMYVRSRGFVTVFADQQAPPHANAKLVAMAARLRQNLAPGEGQDHHAPPVLIRHEHRGIPFNEWLDLFLEYALKLALTQQPHEAYEVLTAAKDSVVFKTKENTFLIHVAHAACAVIAGDEEQCISVARFFMREYMQCSDSYRIMAALCRVCQAPVSWYSSGPAQKFILRQIRVLDKATLGSGPNGEGTGSAELDVCLLTIYGHIMFTTTSYTYALGYFMRAASIDPGNPMINLSLGIGYIHYALKRQATNRQYLLTQGFAFLSKYHGPRSRSASAAERQEAHFNMGRAYHIVGLGPLATAYYARVLEEAEEQEERSRAAAADGSDVAVVEGSGVASIGREELVLEAAYNIKTICFGVGDLEGAKAVTDRWLVL